jgi:hypothetical protein
MKLKQFINIIGLLILILILFANCSRYKEILNTDKIKLIHTTVNPSIDINGIESLEGLKIIFTNFLENIKIEKEITGTSIGVEGLIPGIYTIVISGKAANNKGQLFYLNGSLVNYPIFNDNETIKISVTGLKISPLVFKEIYYAGSPKNYFRDQFYEIYNNSDSPLYLDGLYFAALYPTIATENLPVWPESDGKNFVYSDRLWKFTGNGTQYPLKPGESCIVSQFAANHQMEIYNPNSPIDCSSSEFEFNMNNKNFPDQPAVDMVHIFSNGSSAMGTLPQYLTSVFGGAYVIFKVPDGVIYDPVGDKTLQTKNLATSSTILYAKIPIPYVLDGVEAGHNETMVKAKRMAGVLDAGMTYVGATYIGLGVVRKKIAENEDGTPVLQDTNNSTDDFERGFVPMFRRYNSKMPSWNHTLN